MEGGNQVQDMECRNQGKKRSCSLKKDRIIEIGDLCVFRIVFHECPDQCQAARQSAEGKNAGHGQIPLALFDRFFLFHTDPLPDDWFFIPSVSMDRSAPSCCLLSCLFQVRYDNHPTRICG